MIQEMAKKYPPNLLYRLKDDGNRCTLYSYSEDGTVTVNITGEYNLVAFNRQVFGIDQKTLTECEPPEEGQPIGTMLNNEQTEDFISLVLEEIKQKNN